MRALARARQLFPLTAVIPAQAGISVGLATRKKRNGDPRLRGDDVEFVASVGYGGGYGA